MHTRRRFKQTLSLNDRLAAEALRLRQQASDTSNPIERDLLLHRAEQYDAAQHMDGYLRSAELQPPS